MHINSEDSDYVDPLAPIGVLGLSVRSCNALLRLGFRTVGELIGHSREGLLSIPNMGKQTVRDVEEALATSGFALRSPNGSEASSPPACIDEPVFRSVGELCASARNDLVARLVSLAELQVGISGADATMGDLLDDLALDTSASRTGLREQLRAVRLVDIVEVPAAELTWQVRLTRAVEALDDRSREIVGLRLPASDQWTLDDIGKCIDLTRERVRQLESKARERIAKDPVVEAAARRFAALAVPFGRLEELRAAGFDPSDRNTMCLAFVARQFDLIGQSTVAIVDSAGHQWLVASKNGARIDPGEVVGDVFVEVFGDRCGDRAELSSAVAERLATWGMAGMRLREIADILVAAEQLEDVPGLGLVSAPRSVLDSAERVLAEAGEPLDLDTLFATIGRGSRGNLSNGLARDTERFYRTSDRRIALEGWDYPRAKTLVDWMTEQIEAAGGRISLRRLEAAVSDSFAASSVGFYATMNAQFVNDDGVIRLRTSEDAMPSDVWVRANGFLVVDGPHSGCWSVHLVVNYDRMYRGSTVVPIQVAGMLGVGFNDSVDVRTSSGTTLKFTCRGTSPYFPSTGGFRELVASLGTEDDDRVRVIVTGHSQVEVERLDAIDDSNPITTIATTIGSAARDVDPLVVDLARAIGLEGTAEVPEIFERLSLRRDPLRQSLTMLFPELTG